MIKCKMDSMYNTLVVIAIHFILSYVQKNNLY